MEENTLATKIAALIQPRDVGIAPQSIHVVQPAVTQVVRQVVTLAAAWVVLILWDGVATHNNISHHIGEP